MQANELNRSWDWGSGKRDLIVEYDCTGRIDVGSTGTREIQETDQSYRPCPMCKNPTYEAYPNEKLCRNCKTSWKMVNGELRLDRYRPSVWD